MTAISSSINLCPINFKLFDCVNAHLKDVEATLLYSKLKFHQTHSVLKKDNQVCIARTREEIAAWFGFGLKKVDRLLSVLESCGLIQKTTSTWYGKKRLFISACETVDQSPINIKLLEVITQHTQSIKASLVFSKIAFRFANTKITNENRLWCTMNKQDLALWANCSIRTIDALLEILIKTGLILKKNFIYRSKSQSHYHIPNHVIENLLLNRCTEPLAEVVPNENKGSYKSLYPVNNQVTHSQSCRSQPAKKTLFTRIRSNEKKTNNNTSNLIPKESEGKSDIIFSNIGEQLSIRQIKYLESALMRTIERTKIRISNPKELWEQLKFALLSPQQRLHTDSFQHAVSRFMKILGNGNWKTPIGFYKHSEAGQQIKANREYVLQSWKRQKEEECKNSLNIKHQLILHSSLSLNENMRDQSTQQAMHLAKQIRYIATAQGNSQGRAGMIDGLTKQLHGFIRQGADKDQVLRCLRNELP